MTLRQELRSCRAQLASTQATLEETQRDLAACEAGSSAKDTEIASLQVRVLDLTKSVDDLPAASVTLEAQLEAYATPVLHSTDRQSINAALADVGEGNTLRLDGSFSTSVTIRPKAGQRLLGPATIRGVDMGVNTDLV